MMAEWRAQLVIIVAGTKDPESGWGRDLFVVSQVCRTN